MTRLSLVASPQTVREATNATHRASQNEGEAARRLLEDQGYRMKRKANNQFEFACCFHEGPEESDKKTTSFYLHATSSVYVCHSASCGERGNLQTLERYFGVDQDDSYVTSFVDRNTRLNGFEQLLTPTLRKPLYDHGLTDQTIERFRLGYDPEKRAIVIPYLEGRRPKFFRYYKPDVGQSDYDPKWKYTWEAGAESTLFNTQDARGDEKNGHTYLCEGELKAMLLVQMGYAAVAVPGAGQWRAEFQAAFTHAHKVFVCYDNDNPEFHIYDKPEQNQRCHLCAGRGLAACAGHNPGQEAAIQRVEQIGWRAKNLLLPLPEGLKKTDINDFFMRDGATNADFAELATGKRATPYKVQSFAEITAAPPQEATFLIEQGILPRGGRLLVAGKPKVGKMSGLSVPVLTPYGWTTMGAIQPGDEVIGPDGLPTKVSHIHPQGVKPLYRVTMSDGSSTNCGLEHLWNVQTHNDREYTKKDGRPRWRTLETSQIMEILAAGKTRDTYIPIVSCVQYAMRPAPILDAYGLGLLLGDGALSRGSVNFTKPDPELHDALRISFPDQTHTVNDPSKGSCNLVSPRDGTRNSNSLITALIELGLRGCRSWEKFIPDDYRFGTPEDRLAILQGLLDTDGWVQWNGSHKNSSAYFSTSSPQLKDHVVEIVESLGGTTTVLHKAAPKFQDDGVGRPHWSVRINLPGDLEPFRLTRKLDEWRSGRTSKNTEPNRRIVSIEYSHDEEAQCITVEREDGLYVTERFIVTHNSIFIDNLALSLAAGIPFLKTFKVDHPTRTLLLDRELSKWSLFTRINALMADRPGYKAAAENLLIDHDHLLRLDQPQAYDLLLQLVEQNGAEVVILDTAYKFFGGDVESSSSLMKGFAVLDKLIHETGVSVIMTHHHKKGQGGQGKQNTDIADPDNVAGSFLWTGWPNGTILLNYLDRSVANPFNSVATFTAFRDAAPPEPLALYRTRESISYSAIEAYSHDEEGPTRSGGSGRSSVTVIKPTTEAVAEILMDVCPTTEDDFLHQASAHFGVSIPTLRPYYIDALSQGGFEKTNGRPPIIKFAYAEQTESWEKEHGMAERPIPENSGASFTDVPMFDLVP